MASGSQQPSYRVIIGVAIVLFASVLVAVGIHHIIQTGTCSSTGYSPNYGPVPYCPAGTGAWIGFLVGGIFLTLIGAGIAMTGVGLSIGPLFVAIGVGSITVAFDKGNGSGQTAFAAIFGGFFLLFGAIPCLFLISGAIKALRRPSSSPSAVGGGTSGRPTMNTVAPTVGNASAVTAFGTPDAASAFGATKSEPDAILGAYTAGGQPPSVASQVPPASPLRAAPQSGDVMDKIAKLADLHTRGALTDDEFTREKAKLLAEL